jgi:hypothetical protein
VNLEPNHAPNSEEETASPRVEPDSPSAPVWRPALKEAGWAFLAAAVVLAAIYTLTFERIHPEFARFMERNAQPLTAFGKDFLPVSIGKAQRKGQDFVVEDFNGDEAILALPRAFDAEDYPFIKVNLSGFTRYSKAKILWQREGETETHALEFNRSGSEVTQIAMVYGGEQYAGRINSIALLFYDGPALGFENNDDVDIVIDSIEFRPFSAMRVAEQIFEDWTNPPLWQGRSNNIVRGIHANGMVFPNAVANLLVVTGLAVAGLVRLSRKWQALSPPAHRLLATALCLCLYGWAFNDLLRWHWRIEQLIDTHERYAGLPLEERIRNNDIRCARFPEDCAAHLLPYF